MSARNWFSKFRPSRNGMRAIVCKNNEWHQINVMLLRGCKYFIHVYQKPYEKCSLIYQIYIHQRDGFRLIVTCEEQKRQRKWEKKWRERVWVRSTDSATLLLKYYVYTRWHIFLSPSLSVFFRHHFFDSHFNFQLWNVRPFICRYMKRSTYNNNNNLQGVHTTIWRCAMHTLNYRCKIQCEKLCLVTKFRQ